jgi:hypothetical protein
MGGVSVDVAMGSSRFAVACWEAYCCCRHLGKPADISAMSRPALGGKA